MDCNKAKEKLVDFVDNNLLPEERKDLETHLSNCPECVKEIEELKEVVQHLAAMEMEEPSSNVRANFEAMLEEELSKTAEKPSKVITLNKTKNWSTIIQVAASIVLVFSAFLLGRFQAEKSEHQAENIEIHNEKEVLALLKNESPSKRILGVNHFEKLPEENNEIINAIINKLLYDENTNVRLAAAEALSKFTGQEIVKIALLESLQSEKEAVVQIEIIQMLAEIQEKRALNTMQKLLEEEETPDFVKTELKYNIASIL